MWHLLVVINQYDGWDTEQVEQVDTDTQTGHIGDEHKPTIAMRLVGSSHFQDEPEYGGKDEERINLTLDS